MRGRLAGELLGTFALVFAGTGAIVIDGVTGGAVGHVGIGLSFGLAVMIAIYAVGDVSGAHINPAVTLGFFVARRFPGRDVLPYVGAQVAGAFAASATLALLFRDHPDLGSTRPAVLGGHRLVGESFVLEIVLTLILMFVILSVTTGAKERGAFAGQVIGGVVALEALFAGPICGASMNPARSLAPAVLSGTLDSLWIYLAAPVVGALAAVPCCTLVRPDGCCRACPVET